MVVLSPVTGTNNVKEVDRFNVKTIIQKYKEGLGLNVTDYFQNLDHISLYQCNSTGYRFYFPFSIAADSSFYQELMLKELYYTDWKWENEKAFKFIKEADKVLDIGCGAGAFIKALSGKLNISAEGIELNPDAIKKAKADGLVVFQETVENFAVKRSSYYDVVTSFQVLEHIADVKGFLSAKLDLLKPGGLMVIGVPNNNPYLYRKDKYHTLNLPPHHMGLWNKPAFENLPKVFKVTLEKINIEKIDDIVYYAFVQFGLQKQYRSLMKKNPAKLMIKLLNKIKAPSFLMKGRNIVVVFKKI